MMENIQFQSAQKEDLNEIIQLLKDNKLPFEDIESNKIHFIKAYTEGGIIGCIGVEEYENEGLLRSLAVADAYKHKGVGGHLIKELQNYCFDKGIHNLHLLTTTAEKYFLSKNFQIGKRENAPMAIKSTTEFSFLCPSSSIYMVYKEILSSQ